MIMTYFTDPLGEIVLCNVMSIIYFTNFLATVIVNALVLFVCKKLFTLTYSAMLMEICLVL